jgi:hypothetical protein
MKYSYKMVQVPPNIEVTSKGQRGNEAATYMSDVVNQHARDGWEFYRVDPIGVNVKPGCIASIFGQKEVLYTYYVICFRKEVE